MPNGEHWIREQWQAVEDFFARIGPVLSGFAEAYGLSVEKFCHGAPCWSLLFRHPGGGMGKIDVARSSDDYLRLSTYRWIDDYRQGIRFLRAEEDATTDVPCFEDSSVLIDTLEMILGWQRDDLTPHVGYKDAWQRQWTEDQFEQLNNEYSTPRIE
jgi:hypothetical protein